MAFLVPGCVRCRIRCVGSGRMMRARSCWVRKRMPHLGNWWQLVVWVRASSSYLILCLENRLDLCSWWYCGVCWESWGCVCASLIARVIDFQFFEIHTEIVMVRLQGDFAKPPEKRFNYKHCFDALYRVRLSDSHSLLPRILPALFDDVTVFKMSRQHDV